MLCCEVLPDWRRSYFHPYGERYQESGQEATCRKPKKKTKTEPALSLGDHEVAVIIRTFFFFFFVRYVRVIRTLKILCIPSGIIRVSGKLEHIW